MGLYRAYGREKFHRLGELKLKLQGTMEPPGETRAVEEALGETDH